MPACADDENSNADQSPASGIDAAVSPEADAGSRSVLDAALRPSSSTNPCYGITDAGTMGLRARMPSDRPPPPNNDGIIGFLVYPCGDSVVDASTQSLDAGSSNNELVARSVNRGGR